MFREILDKHASVFYNQNYFLNVNKVEADDNKSDAMSKLCVMKHTDTF